MTDAPFSLPPDYTLPTLEQRIEAAAKAFRAATVILIPADPKWHELPEDTRSYYRHEVEYVCRAFAPEHFKAETGDVA